jgi:4-hydroxythreonine-4-phosphate dehydrogenase
MSHRARIGITIGDPSGIGPELALRVASRLEGFPFVELTLIGNHSLLSRVAKKLKLQLPTYKETGMWLAAKQYSSVLSKSEAVSITVGNLDAKCVEPGNWSLQTGLASFEWVRFAILAALSGRLDAIVTGPIQKEAWREAGISQAGHTEVFAELTSSDEYAMLMTCRHISCVLVTSHLPFADVAASLTQEKILRAIRLGSKAIQNKSLRFAGRFPRIAVCGLNPHAGENGLLGHCEESDVIIPAIQQAKELGIDIVGPLAPDTAFVPERRREIDLYVCMYHDQGLIPLKALAFDEAVNVTIGIPIVRTSVGHGTGMDIAWQGSAKENSLIFAVREALSLI